MEFVVDPEQADVLNMDAARVGSPSREDQAAAAEAELAARLAEEEFQRKRKVRNSSVFPPGTSPRVRSRERERETREAEKELNAEQRNEYIFMLEQYQRFFPGLDLPTPTARRMEQMSAHELRQVVTRVERALNFSYAPMNVGKVLKGTGRLVSHMSAIFNLGLHGPAVDYSEVMDHMVDNGDAQFRACLDMLAIKHHRWFSPGPEWTLMLAIGESIVQVQDANARALDDSIRRNMAAPAQPEMEAGPDLSDTTSERTDAASV